MKRMLVFAVIFMSHQAAAGGYVMAPNGQFVSGPGYTMAPNGQYVSGPGFQMTPDGSYVGSPASESEPSDPPAMRDYRDFDGGDSEE